jgi:peptidyl-prolyl cis-trans isomerase SurA
MGLTALTTTGRWLMGAIALAAACVSMAGQTPVVPATTPQANAAAPTAAQGVVLDRLVAVVNTDMILESDVDEERRFEEIQPYRSAVDSTRARIIERLVDRALILQQAALQPEDAVPDKDLDDQIARVRKDIPACKQYHCETEQGWQKFLGEHGFTEQEFRTRWLQRMQLLKFIEVRFRNGIEIKEDEIKEYYEKTMLPAYAKRNVTPPALDTLKTRIEEVLLQQRVSALLEDWLKSLRAQGSVRIMVPGEVSP